MPELKIGTLWAPKISLIPSSSKTNPEKVTSVTRESELIYKPEKELVDGLFVPPRDPRKMNKILRKSIKDTTGQGWFDMPAPTITPELKKDLEILKLRNVIDPKQHFKKGGQSKGLPKYFQMGTVIEPMSEFFSSRLSKKERKATLADELLSDQTLKQYRKRKINEIKEKRQPGGVEKWKNRGHQTWKRAKQRRG
ncbi:LOW QUALITY PROTEIN: rRNA-processing protein fcf2-like [Dioscorea cayenensis subsp. rotundata]|uniref:LOW QUALITY PROTEIN: rRNA-processing protein fcf2-like n=1 Tax=Dioscorea cayennensis subsp. rotundata TaxID=55577 RepID=A0AB40BPM9_DIOCR|nr:LOW QUALITY PROTEIN: rRNA-processing protein fcf2-like [Dioscorea cayenensis subsp. rotundata]